MNSFQRVILSLVFFILLSNYGCKQSVSLEKRQHPNVLLILCDDLNDYQGAFGGHPQAFTPHIDRLAASGVRFVNAQTNIGLCNPSRNSLFTGVYPHQSGNFGLDKKSTQKLFRNNKTIMELFSEKGYYVMGSGKLLHSNIKGIWDEWGVNINNYGPFAYDGEKQVGHPSVPQPFRDIGDIDGSFAPLSDIPKFNTDEVKGDNAGWAYSGREGKVFRYVNETNRDLVPDELHAQWAAKRIKEMDAKGSEQPFFMGIGFVRPHTPLYAPRRFFDMFPIDELHLPAIKEGDADDTYYKDNYPVERTKDDKWFTNTSKGQMYSKILTEAYNGNEEEGLKHFLQAYLACVAFVDEQVGIVLDALNDSQFAENTVVVLTSDHGWQMGQKQYLFKNSPWENSTRIPLVVNVPGIEPGLVVKQPVSLVDIYPSLVEICNLGADNKKNEQGFSLGGFSFMSLITDSSSANWQGPKGTLTAIATDSVDYNPDAQTFAYRTKDFRYIIYPNGSEELYNLQKDPHEWHNVAVDIAYDTHLVELRKEVEELIKLNR